MASPWTLTNPLWAQLNPYQRAAAMSLLETHDPKDATNVLGAMVNRARADKAQLGDHVGTKIYQPSIEPAQEARLNGIVRNPEFMNLAQKAQSYWNGDQPVPHKATHFLAPESTMVALEAKEPDKYKSWRDWTGYDGKSYKNVVLRDGSHVFLTPPAPDEKGLVPPAPTQPYPKNYTPVDHNPFDVYEYGKALAAKQDLQNIPRTLNPETLKPKADPTADIGMGVKQVLPNVSGTPTKFG